MINPVQLDDCYFVASQIAKEDLAALKVQGFERVINNRPEGESEDQPAGEDVRLAAEALGIEYVSNPIDLAVLSQGHVDLQLAALTDNKKTLAFCRTGTRSSVLWVLLRGENGKEYSRLFSQVAEKGFDLSRCAVAMAPLLKV